MIITYPDEITLAAIKNALKSLIHDAPKEFALPYIRVRRDNSLTVKHENEEETKAWNKTMYEADNVKRMIEWQMEF